MKLKPQNLQPIKFSSIQLHQPIQFNQQMFNQLHHFLTWVGKLTKCDGALHDSTNQFKQKVLALPFDKMPVAAVLRPNSNGTTIKKSLPYKSASVSETQCHFSGDSKWQKSVPQGFKDTNVDAPQCSGEDAGSPSSSSPFLP